MVYCAGHKKKGDEMSAKKVDRLDSNNFDDYCSGYVNHIAKWDGAAWRELCEAAQESHNPHKILIERVVELGYSAKEQAMSFELINDSIDKRFVLAGEIMQGLIDLYNELVERVVLLENRIDELEAG